MLSFRAGGWPIKRWKKITFLTQKIFFLSPVLKDIHWKIISICFNTDFTVFLFHTDSAINHMGGSEIACVSLIDLIDYLIEKTKHYIIQITQKVNSLIYH